MKPRAASAEHRIMGKEAGRASRLHTYQFIVRSLYPLVGHSFPEIVRCSPHVNALRGCHEGYARFSHLLDA